MNDCRVYGPEKWPFAIIHQGYFELQFFPSQSVSHLLACQVLRMQSKSWSSEQNFLAIVLFSWACMPDDLHFMRLALAEARASAQAGEVPIGAVLVQNEKIVAQSGNRTICDNDPTAHAEIVVIRESARRLGNYRLADTSLYVTLEPCAMCAGAIVLARIPRLVYAADDPKGGAFRSCFAVLTSSQLNHRVEVTPGILAEDAAALLQSFFSSRR
jgi:tRNA(adenine34) deaminase